MAAPSDLPRPDAPPDAPVVWMHIGLRPRHSALAPWVSLAQRLLAQRGDVQIVITTPTPLPDRAFEALPPDQDLVVRLVPEESAPEIAQFLARVRPTVALWVGNDLRPALMHATTRTGCRMIALDMRDTRFGVPTLRWLSDKAAQVLDLCSDAVAVDTAAMMRLRRLGLRHVTLHQRGALPDNPVPPDCPPEDLAQATRTLDGRTVWLAACVAVDELDTVLRAHRLASRYAHRLLLILMPEAGVC
ncbi:MAG: glycosyltransferase N-terminal domain-containing protein, partial [Paracoccaceae bacterium]